MSESRRSLAPEQAIGDFEQPQPNEAGVQIGETALPVSSGEVGAGATALDRSTGPRLDADANVAKRAVGSVGTHMEDAFLAGIETWLADEVFRLVSALREFSGRTQLICQELPERAHFSESVTGFLSLIGLQLADALAKGLDRAVLFDDGAQYLGELGLSLQDLFREFDLDSSRFLAIALINESARHGASDRKDANKCADLA